MWGIVTEVEEAELCKYVGAYINKNVVNCKFHDAIHIQDLPRRSLGSKCLTVLGYCTKYYIKNQQDATLAVSFISHCKITPHVSDAFCVHHQEY